MRGRHTQSTASAIHTSRASRCTKFSEIADANRLCTNTMFSARVENNTALTANMITNDKFNQAIKQSQQLKLAV